MIQALINSIKNIIKQSTRGQLLEHALLILLLSKFISQSINYHGGVKRLIGSKLYRFINKIPIVQKQINSKIENEARNAIIEIFKNKPKPTQFKIPSHGLSEEELFYILEERSKQDVNPSEGRNWAYIYQSNPNHNRIVHKAYSMFMDKNALNSIQFVSLRNMEIELVAMAANLFNGPIECVGQMTSCGTESLLMMVKCYRDYGFSKNPDIKPEIIICSTTHPSVSKAAHYFGIKLIVLEQDENLQLPVKQLQNVINQNTVLIVASAPQFSHGVIDDIVEIAKIAKFNNVPLHVDSCIGGFALPWIERAGYDVPLWDFRVDGVTSISADLHKYGFAAKGASLLIYISDDYRRYQYYSLCRWAGGIYISPNMTGTRGGGPFAGAWASLMELGEDGFMSIFTELMKTVDYFKNQITQIPGLRIIGKPTGTLLAIGSVANLSIFHVADELEEIGWFMERQSNPPSIHLTVMPQHNKIREQFIQDLKNSVKNVINNPEKHAGKSGSAGVYGLIAKIPDDMILDSYMSYILSQIYKRND